MKVLMISINRKAVFPVVPLGTGLASAIARRAGHEVHLLDLWWEADYKNAAEKALNAFQPQVVGISIRNTGEITSRDQPDSYIDYIRNVVQQCRAFSSEPQVILGGYGFSCAPEAFLLHCGANIGIIGEAEIALPSLLDRVQKQLSLENIPNVILRKNEDFIYGPRHRLEELGNISWPAWDLYDQRYHQLETTVPAMGIQTKRGCAFRCLDCDVPAVDSHYYRLRPVDKVVDELEQIKKDIDPKWIYFADNIFNDPPAYADKLCREIIRRGIFIPWVTFAVPHRGNKDLYALMKEADCLRLVYEIQSASTEMLPRWKKCFQPQDILQAAEWSNEVGIQTFFLIQFGGPQETVETVRESIKVCEQLKYARVKIQIPRSGLKLGSIFDSPWAKNNPIHGGEFEAGDLSPEAEELIEQYIENNKNVLLEKDDVIAGAQGTSLFENYTWDKV